MESDRTFTGRTFTGRPRRRTTRPAVRAADRIARVLITFGGIGTIVAVLLVGVFLVTVAAPLFRGATTRPVGPSDGVSDVGRSGVAALGCDESGAVAWVLDASTTEADAAAIHLIGLADGERLLRRPAAECGLANATVVRTLPGRLHAAVGFADGSFQSGRLGLESSFVEARALPIDGPPPGPGRAVAAEGGAIVGSDEGRVSRLRLVAEFAEPVRTLGAAIVDVDLAILEGGPLIAALDASGAVRVEAVSSRRNLLTDEVIQSSAGSTIEPVVGFSPRFVRVSELGDQLFLIATDGTAVRYVIRDVEAPVRMESFAVATAKSPVTAVERLFGGVGILVADRSGLVREFFASRSASGAAEDGLKMVGARSFDGVGAGAAVTSLAASPRSRLFAAADAAGGVRLVQATSGKTVLELPVTAAADGPVALGIGPREDRLLAVRGGRLTAASLSLGYPDVTAGTLLGPVWYENYPGPAHAWETTGHEAFEAKFGLLPLVFGTLKATLYAMLFATPLAILAAIYASQFVHARWRARIKPTIELMAGLPSVVLGFIAGLVLAPVVERAVMPMLTALFAVPLALLTGAHLWQFVPAGWRSQLDGWRFAVVGLGAIPAGIAASWAAAPVVERLLFQGDFRGWLDGRGDSGFGGWVVALLPLAAVVSTAALGRTAGPWLRRSSRGWSDRRAALASLGVFLAGAALTIALAAAAAMFCDALRIDTRGGLFGTYVQRNALVVGIGMSFAIIPLIFTIADDALTSVPEHLRSASLGAGATPWQTAVRVIVPAAASGLFSAVMIGLGRAVGETMIVLMAAGNTPIVDWNVFNGFQTLSAAIATELPEAARGSAHYRVLFLAALVLFALTFVVNTAAELVRQRFRRRSHEL
jgi:phosphate transport system permease protein